MHGHVSVKYFPLIQHKTIIRLNHYENVKVENYKSMLWYFYNSPAYFWC